MHSYFDSPEAKQEVEKLYFKKLHQLDIAFEMLKIETSFGETNIIVTGEKKNPPLVLIHGSNRCAPIAIEAMQNLITHFRIFAIDVVGQPNLSAENRPEKEDLSYGMWMYEILTRLHVKDVTLVGISFGGFVSLKVLQYDHKHIREVFLINPAGIVEGNPLQAILKVFWPIQMYKWRKNPVFLQQFLQEIFNEEDEFANEFLSKVFLHFKMDCSNIPLISKKEANTIHTPLNIIASEQDVLFPGRKLLDRAEEIFPSLKQANLLEKSKHIPDFDNNQEIIRMILKTQI